jgi:GcrA cell cycle regulator
MGWTEERVELLRKLWLEGLSASQIAGVLGEGVTRNAVIGKVHRLKLSGRAKPAAAAPRVRQTPRTAPAVSSPARRITSPSAPRPSTNPISAMMKARPMASVQGATALKMSEDLAVDLDLAPAPAEMFIPVDQRLSLLDLSEVTCKWPIGDPLSSEFYFCGQHSVEGKPYCEFHARRAFHHVDKKRR